MTVEHQAAHSQETVPEPGAEAPAVLVLKNDSICLASCKAWPKGQELPKPRANTWLEEFLAVSTLLLAFGWVITVPFFAALPVWLLERMPGFLDLHIWDTWRRYFRMRAITPEQPYLSKGRSYLFVQFPHACCPIACWLVLGMAATPSAGLPMPIIRAVIADVMFALPVVKQLLGWGGCHPARKSTMLRLLHKGCLGCLPEGIAGVFHGATPERERIYLSPRKGFVRLAIQAGADLVPMYHLGQSQLLTYRGFPKLSRRLRITLGWLWGRWYLPLPRKQDIVTLVGNPIAVEQADNPTAAYVDLIHMQLTEAVQELYNRHRHVLPGWEQRDLTIV
ncbi:hypothetical protein WJX73_006767 [Symbiochloris irregularis]|uniref:Acyltransferase n=1 Tax=Symbiochloris irregularis TaxID=706552 RepID=A0AAW1P5N4_9CHLO